MPNNSPRRKEAARTIKRAVMKSHVKTVFRNYTGNKYRNIKTGKAPANAAALFRRMKMFPVTINTPLYRGIINKNGKLMKQLRNSGGIQNSFASFSRLESVARRFLEYRPSSNANRLIFMLPPGRYPAINSRTFKTNAPFEMEVLLAPGKYILNNKKPSNSGILHLKYIPSNKLIYHTYNN